MRPSARSTGVIQQAGYDTDNRDAYQNASPIIHADGSSMDRVENSFDRSSRLARLAGRSSEYSSTKSRDAEAIVYPADSFPHNNSSGRRGNSLRRSNSFDRTESFAAPAQLTFDNARRMPIKDDAYDYSHSRAARSSRASAGTYPDDYNRPPSGRKTDYPARRYGNHDPQLPGKKSSDIEAASWRSRFPARQSAAKTNDQNNGLSHKDYGSYKRSEEWNMPRVENSRKQSDRARIGSDDEYRRSSPQSFRRNDPRPSRYERSSAGHRPYAGSGTR